MLLDLPTPQLVRFSISHTLGQTSPLLSTSKVSFFINLPRYIGHTACKRLLRYLKETATMALHFHPCSSTQLVGFADADYASCVDDRLSTGGYCVYYGDNLISKKQSVVSLNQNT